MTIIKKVTCWFAIIILLFALISEFIEINNKISVTNNEVRTIGKVILSEYDTVRENYTTIIEYYDASGTRYELHSTTGYHRGSDIEVQYERGNPSNVFTTDFQGSWLIIIFKILFLLLFLSLILSNLRKPKTE